MATVDLGKIAFVFKGITMQEQLTKIKTQLHTDSGETST